MPAVPSSIKSLRAYSKALPQQGRDESDMADELASDSDRAFIILLSSFVENSLTEAIIERLPGYSDEIDNDIFGSNAPLSAFSSKIRIGQAMGIFGSKTRACLDVLRELRNACAHAMRPISFSTPTLKAVCRRLPLEGAPAENETEAHWMRHAFNMYAIYMQRALNLAGTTPESLSAEERDRYLA